MCIDYLKNPSEAVEEVENKSLRKSIGVMAISALIFAINSAIAMNLLQRMSMEVTGPQIAVKALNMGTVNLGIGVFVVIFLGGLFFGWLTKLIMNILGGDGGYFEGLTTVAYPVLAATVGILVAILVSYVPMVGSLLSFLAVAISFAVGYASMYRFSRELFNVKMITAFVGISVLFAIVMVSIYGGLATSAAGLKAIVPSA